MSRFQEIKSVGVTGSLFTAGELDALAGTARMHYLDAHPVLLNNYVLPTPPIERVTDLVLRALSYRDRGIAFCGVQGMGKTHALKYILGAVRREYSSLPIVELEAKDSKIPSERRFCECILAGVGSPKTTYRQLTSGTQHVINVLITLALDHRADHMLIPIDEAQNLQAQEWQWLKTIANSLAAAGIQLTVLLFGQMRLAAMRESFLAQGISDIVNRFMPTLHAFDGLRSVDEVKQVLRWYDDDLVFPLGSGCTTSVFFRYSEFMAGWRMESEAAHLWNAAKAAPHVTAGFDPADLQIGMETIIKAVHRYFREAVNQDEASEQRWRNIFATIDVVHSSTKP